MHGILSGIKRQTLKIREKTKDFDAHETARHAHSANFREIPFLLSENFQKVIQKILRAQNCMTKLHRSVTESLKATTLLFIFNFFNPNQAVKNKKKLPSPTYAIKPPIFGKAKFFAWYIIRVFSRKQSDPVVISQIEKALSVIFWFTFVSKLSGSERNNALKAKENSFIH